MTNREPETRELKEAHRHSAERVRTLLEELEAAEKEFAILTDKVKALNESIPPRSEYTPIAAR
jgi:hypothetical protein